MIPGLPTAIVFGGSHLPAMPTRDQMCRINTTGMQNARNWWEVVVTSPDVSEAKRLEQYAAKRANGEDCQIIAISWRYDPCGYAGRDLWNDLPSLRAYITEALTAGGMSSVLLMLAGDGMDYSVEGWTYGFTNLMAAFQRIYDGLKGVNGEPDLTPYIVWCPGFDGVVPGWDPDNDGGWRRVEQWLLFCRSVIGDTAVSAIELSAGYWCWTEQNRYSDPAGQALDVVLYEFPVPFGPTTIPIPADFCRQSNDARAPFDQVWQCSKRLLGSLWMRPVDMPTCDDPGMASDLPSTPRGHIFVNAFEYLTYMMVRGWMTPTDLAVDHAYIAGMGWQDIG